jgi:hypothetical protein
MVRSGLRAVLQRNCQALACIVNAPVPSYSSPVVVKTNSQGGVKVPTGGNRILPCANVRSPRALLVISTEVNRRTADSVRFRGRQLKSGYENEVKANAVR